MSWESEGMKISGMFTVIKVWLLTSMKTNTREHVCVCFCVCVYVCVCVCVSTYVCTYVHVRKREICGLGVTSRGVAGIHGNSFYISDIPLFWSTLHWSGRRRRGGGGGGEEEEQGFRSFKQAAPTYDLIITLTNTNDIIGYVRSISSSLLSSSLRLPSIHLLFSSPLSFPPLLLPVIYKYTNQQG